MFSRENALLEASKYMHENTKTLSENRESIHQKHIQEKANFMKRYYGIKESREEKLKAHSSLIESAKNDALSTALKAIYITALEAGTLTDNGIILAENMVDSWIKEKGGATVIFNEARNKTYFLSRLQQIVEDAAKEEVDQVEKDESDPEIENKSEDKSDDNEPKENNNSEKESLNSDNDSKELSSDPLQNPDEFDDIDNDGVDDVSDPDTDDLPMDNDPDNDDSEAADDIIDKMEDSPVSMDGDGKENQGKVFDELEKEEDVKKAIELIRQRVADAEEAFIKRNAEDKKQIDDLLGKISDNVKTVEDLSDNESPESKIAQEAARMNRRKIQNITENRPLTVLEKMTRKLSADIVKHDVLKEHYITESGNLDMNSVFEAAKVMYGFLETINTLQLEKVNSAYIKKVLNEM